MRTGGIKKNSAIIIMAPRPIKHRCIGFHPDIELFSPIPKWTASGTVNLYTDELEALRLVDYVGLSQEEASERMCISRGTVWRLLQSARKKIVSMVIEHKELMVKKTNR